MSKASRAGTEALQNLKSVKYGDYDVTKDWMYVSNPLRGSGGANYIVYNPNDPNQKFGLGSASDENLHNFGLKTQDYDQYLKQIGAGSDQQSIRKTFGLDTLEKIEEEKRLQELTTRASAGQISGDEATRLANQKQSFSDPLANLYNTAYQNAPKGGAGSQGIQSRAIITPDGKTHTVEIGSEAEKRYLQMGGKPGSEADKQAHSNYLKSLNDPNSANFRDPNQPQTSNQLAALQQTMQPQTPSFALTGGNLKVGARGQNVSQLQQLLGIKADGIYGPQTQAAVIAFQQKNGLKADGIVGPQTTAALAKMGGSSSGTLTQGQNIPGTGIVNFDVNTGQRLAPGATTTPNSNIQAQMQALNPTTSTTPSLPTSSPTVPAPSQNRDTSLDSYLSQVAALQGLSKEEESAQKELDQLNANATQGQFNVSQQPIAQSFISGQQAAMQEQANIAQMPLQQKLALAQQKRMASLDAAKTRLDQANADRDYKLKEKSLEGEGFSLSEGEKRYDAKGNLIASGGPKTYAPTVGDLSSKQYTALNQITTRFQADPIINQSVKGSTAVTIADQIIANPSAATSQLKSLYVLVKNLDPDSAVREGELALANQTQSYFQQFSNSLARLGEGRVINPDAAVALAQATKELMTAWNTTAKKREQQYISQSNTLGIGNEFNSYLQGSGMGYNTGGITGGSGNGGGFAESW